MSHIKALLFDLDGTLLDTREYIWGAYRHVVQQITNSGISDATLQKIAGWTLEDSYAHLLPGEPFSELIEQHRVYQKSILYTIKAFPGAYELLNDLQTRNIKTAICTSRKNYMLETLKQNNIHEFFSVIIGANDVTHHKPHPEALIKAMQMLDVAPEHCWMIGDTHLDIEAGKSAKVAKTIGITHGMDSPEALLASNPDNLVTSLSDIIPLIANPVL